MVRKKKLLQQIQSWRRIEMYRKFWWVLLVIFILSRRVRLQLPISGKTRNAPRHSIQSSRGYHYALCVDVILEDEHECRAAASKIRVIRLATFWTSQAFLKPEVILNNLRGIILGNKNYMLDWRSYITVCASWKFSLNCNPC